MIIRRHFLRDAGACLALPLLGRAADQLPPQRPIAIHVPLGMMPQFFFPQAGGSEPGGWLAVVC